MPQRRFILGRTLTLLLAMAASVGVLGQGPVLVGLRYDDFVGPPAKGPDQRLRMENALFAACRRVGLVPTVSVVPAAKRYLDENLGPWDSPAGRQRVLLLRSLATRGAIDLAQHGYRHDFRPDEREASEVAGLPEARQREMISFGKQVLRGLVGRSVTTFVPPANSYDAATLDALAATGFQVISGMLGEGPAHREDLMYVPVTVEFAHLEDAVRNAAAYPGPTLVIAMLHPYEIRDYAEGTGQHSMAEIEATLLRIKAISGVEFTSIGQVQREHPELACASHFRAAAELTPRFRSRVFKPLVYLALGGRQRWAWWPQEVYRGVRWVFAVPYAGGITLVTGVGLATVAWRRRQWRRSGRRRLRRAR